MFGLFSRKQKSDIPQKLYRQLVSQARSEDFFTRYGFEDTVMGRFDCLVMHMFLLSDRLARGKHPHLASLNQDIYDCFVNELDTALREIGVGDPTVPKRKKKFVRSYYGTIGDFHDCIDHGVNKSLVEKVEKRFLVRKDGESEDKAVANRHEHAKMLADYMWANHNVLKSVTDEELLSGTARWSTP